MFKNNTKQNHNNLPSGLVLYPSQQEVIESLLGELQQQISAKFLLLADITGQVIFSKGNSDTINLADLDSLITSNLTVSQKIAHLAKHYQDQQMVLQKNESTYTFICKTGHHLALFIQVSNETPLDWAKMVIHRTIQELGKIVNILNINLVST